MSSFHVGLGLWLRLVLSTCGRALVAEGSGSVMVKALVHYG